MNKLKELFTSRRFKYGSVSTVIALIFIVMIVVVNVVASVLTDKFPLTIDLTPNSAFKLSGESVEFVKGLQKPVSVTVLAKESELQNTTNVYLSQIKVVIDQYAQYNKGISVSYVDIVKDPTFVTKYEDENLTYYDVVVESGQKRRVLSLYDMFNTGYDQQSMQQYIKSSKADEMITSAIMFVTSEANTKVGILSGHEEADTSALQQLLEKNNFEVSEVNLVLDEIDPALDVLFLVAPMRDPDADLLKKLDDFLVNNQQYGKSVVYAASTEQPALPNLDAFLADWGIGVGDGAVFETNSGNILSFTNPYFCTVEYVSEDYTEAISKNVRVSMPFGRPLEQLYDAQSGYQTSVLLEYSGTAGVRPVDADENWQPSEGDLGSIPALIRSTYLRYENTTPLQSNVFVASASAAFEQTLLGSKSVNNADYVMSLMNTVTARDDVITIAPKDLSGSQLGITQFQAIVIAAVMVAVLPLCIIVAGIVIWLRRRHQ